MTSDQRMLFVFGISCVICGLSIVSVGWYVSGSFDSTVLADLVLVAIGIYTIIQSKKGNTE